jgi:hypothetical protein
VERRKLVATAGALSVTAFAATVGLGATFGLFGVTQPDSPIGRLDDRRAVAVAANAESVAGASPAVATTPRIVAGADD